MKYKSIRAVAFVTSIFVGCAMIFGLVFFGCGDDSSQQASQQSLIQTTQQQDDLTQSGVYSEPGLKDAAWPYNEKRDLPKEMQNLPPAGNIFAKNYVLIFDGSGSMAGSKIVEAKEAFGYWTKSVPADANVGLVAFHKEGWSVMNLGTNNRDELNQVISGIKADGGTPLSESCKKAYIMLTSQSLRQFGYGEYMIVIITDGAANSRYDLEEWVSYINRKSSIIISTIGFYIGNRHTLNQPGKTIYKSADSKEELIKGLKEVLAESEEYDGS